jgi:hypothetical protein
MATAAELLKRYRPAFAALAVSAAAHAAVMFSIPQRLASIDDDAPPRYVANLEASMEGQAAAPAPLSAPSRPRPPAPRKARIAPPPPPPLDLSPIASAAPVHTAALGATPDLGLERLALAQPAVPVKALEPEKFPVEALPAKIRIDYQLGSALADGRATYRWSRDGDRYRIDSEAEAEGFFALFLEGRIVQETRGSVGPAGLRPESFSERKPGGPPEGLEFDWDARKVTFDRKGEKSVSALTDDTVDWLSMIFQLAHVPPTQPSFDIQVFTQRRMYRFRLKSLGVEEIEIPIGRVPALHLRHVDEENPKEVVDVWLGVQQHYLPVKLRFPVSRNRLVVEQVATRISED